jgi:hemolysin III
LRDSVIGQQEVEWLLAFEDLQREMGIIRLPDREPAVALVQIAGTLGCSAAYNLASNASRRAFLRRLDHAAIFLMIAGTHTPFTTCRLNGVWAIGMTAAVWTGAITGAVMKLICPRSIKRGSIVAYLALGWMILVGARPMLGSVDTLTAILIGVGGVLYSIGVGFHLWRALPFHKAIWHSFVLVAAGVVGQFEL